ncbi:hypothetical protein M426DRAFT_15646 [Hypoxylon sp. CI-4A]|nr:hypothetical protein M426DRAFT_15646 [Hypoxylon sp. CI-4A]
MADELTPSASIQAKKEAAKLRSIDHLASIVDDTINRESGSLRKDINLVLHQSPEVSYEEELAHRTITGFLEERGFRVTRGAYGMKTCFKAEVGVEGPIVIICAEYDALHKYGHTNGRNLVATASLAAFLGAAEALKRSGAPGRIRLLGTPASLPGQVKTWLIKMGAFNGDIAAAMMACPFYQHTLCKTAAETSRILGCSALRIPSSFEFRTDFIGKVAQANAPGTGVNAFAVAATAYKRVMLLNKALDPDRQVKGYFLGIGEISADGFAELTRVHWRVFSPTFVDTQLLFHRVKWCIYATSLQNVGCQVRYNSSRPVFAEFTPNEALCNAFMQEMPNMITIDLNKGPPITTDMTNVAQTVPTFFGAFGFLTSPINSFQAIAEETSSMESHNAATSCAKGLGKLALRLILDGDLRAQARQEFEHIYKTDIKSTYLPI